MLVGAAGIGVSLSSSGENPVTMGWRILAVGSLGIVSQLLWSVLIIRALRKKNIEAFLLAAAYAGFMGCLVHDIFVLFHVITTDLYWINFGYIIILLTFGTVMARRMGIIAVNLESTTREFECQNENLSDILDKVRESIGELETFFATIKNTAEQLQREMEDQGGSLEETSSKVISTA